MKRLLRSSVAASLALLARLVVRKYRPTVVMITGSVGKTSTKDAINAALSEHTFVRASEKSYNSEFGVPLTVFGVKNPWNNPFFWLRVYEEALALLLLPNHYPKVLVLEVGADRPGDLAKILKIALPDLVVVTRLPEVPVHVEAYASPEAVREEEFVPAYGLAPGSPLIISSKDGYARAYAKRLPITLSTFGVAEDADVRIDDAKPFAEEGAVAGMQAVLHTGGKSYPFSVRGALGRQQLLAPAAAVAAAFALGYSAEDALRGLASYTPPPGRTRLLRGREDSVLIDDSYNSSPAAAEESLNALATFPAKRRIAVLGDMLELGRYSIQEHERIGAYAAARTDILIAVGVRARGMAENARIAGLSEEHVHSFDSASEAADFLLPQVRPGDAILIKGSQGMRLERVVQALLADSADEAKLVRQEREWKRR